MTHFLSVLLALQIVEAPSGAIKLLAGSEEFTKAEGKLATLDGVVERIPSSGKAGGAGLMNRFRLRYQDTDGKETVRELFTGDVGFRVSDHLGKKMRVHGKLVAVKREGVSEELWPAWMQPLTGALVLGVDGVYARCDWQPEEARKRGARQYVIRSGEQLAEVLRVSGSSSAKTATEMLARRLSVPAIDWEKHMLICVCAGLQTSIDGVSIFGVKEKDGVLLVSFRLTPGKGGLGFGYPAQTALVPRFMGEMRFEQEPARPKR